MEHEFISRVVAKPANIQKLDRPVIEHAKWQELGRQVTELAKLQEPDSTAIKPT